MSDLMYDLFLQCYVICQMIRNTIFHCYARQCILKFRREQGDFQTRVKPPFSDLSSPVSTMNESRPNDSLQRRKKLHGTLGSFL